MSLSQGWIVLCFENKWHITQFEVCKAAVWELTQQAFTPIPPVLRGQERNIPQLP